MKPLKKPLRRHNRAGQSLVEFAVVSLVLYMLLAAILTFGHMLYVAQGLQGAADLAAREMSRTPLSANFKKLEDALQDSEVRTNIFDDAWLVIDLDKYPSGPNILLPGYDFDNSMPVLNRQLASLMIVDRTFNPDGTTDRTLLRYPGALLIRNDPIVSPTGSYPPWVATEFIVEIPLVLSRSNVGTETIRWIPVVEEIYETNSGGLYPFDIENPMTRGIVALRINYPFQSASMSSFRHDENHPEYPFEPTVGRPNFAVDGEGNVTSPGNPDAGTLIDLPLVADTSAGPIYTGTYGGKYGLGAQGAFGQIVRPYRRVISAQAIYRREIFSN